MLRVPSFQVLGVLLGYFVPSVRQAFSAVSIDTVSLPVAVGLWGMMWPVLAKVGRIKGGG